VANQHLTDHLTLGPGPFQPPKRSELEDAQARISYLEAEVEALRADEADASQRAREAEDALRRPRTATTGSDLVDLVSQAINFDVDVDIEGTEDCISLHINGATLDQWDEINQAIQEFQVRFSLSVDGRATVRAASEDEADDLVRDALNSWRWAVESTQPDEGDEVTDVEVDSPDVDWTVS
jgi:hypothetical protein